MATIPIKLKQALSLSSYGIKADFLTFSNATLPSDRFVVVRTSNPSELVIIDTAKPERPSRRPLSAEAALLHPGGGLLVLRVGVNLRLFDVARKKELQRATVPEPVVFWKWASSRILGIVTSTAVYHWDVSLIEDLTRNSAEQAANGAKISELQLMFSTHESLSQCQIVNYIVDVSGSWSAVVGIYPVDGRIDGRIQLFSVEKSLSQALDGHAACFIELDRAILFVFSSRALRVKNSASENNAENDEDASSHFEAKLHVIQIGGPPDRFGKLVSDVFYPPDCPKDFPVAIHCGAPRCPSVMYMLTKMGYIHIFDAETASCLYTNRVSESTVFASVPHSSSGGIMGLNRQGFVLLMAVNPDTVVEYVRKKLGDDALAIRLAGRNSLKGAEMEYRKRLEDALDDGQYGEAAAIAAMSPDGFLRTRETVLMFQDASERESDEGGVPPILIYFQTILQHGNLNEIESQLLALHLIQTKKVSLLEKWIREEKLHCSETLGDHIRQTSPTIALAVYIKAAAHEKVLQCMVQTGQTSKVALYANKVGLKVTHRDLVDMAAKFSPQAALAIANNTANALVLSEAANKGKVPLAQIESMVDMFLSKGMLKEATAYAMDNMKDEDTAEGPLQTRILKACLVNMPQVADGILSQDIWHQFDRFKVATLCERIGFFQHALDNYNDLSDVKRVITNTHVINPEFILNYFGTIRPEDQLEVLEELIKSNPRGNIRLCVTVAARYTDSMGGALKVIPVFEKVPNVPDSLFYYLAAIVPASDEPEVHNRFIEVAISLGQFDDAHAVTRDSNFYDPTRIRNFLLEAKPKDPRPLINVCDRFGFTSELVRFLVRNNQMKFVEGYVQRVNPLRCPQVVGALLDLDAMKERELKALILSVKNTTPVEELVGEVEKRGKLGLILDFLESRIGDGSTDAAVHTGVAKVYVDSNMNAQHFLETNAYYDSRALGKFCAKRDPFLAYVAYRRGQCDEELLKVTNDNSLFREQALYLVDRADAELWGKVLDEGNPFRRLVVDQVISTALPSCKKPDKVSAAVKGFLSAGMPDVLMELLEKLVMQTSNTAFSRNTNLQNLLILTAIGAAPERVMEYIRRMDNYDGPDIAPSCIGAGLFEEAYTIYYKFNKFDDALDVLIEHLKDFERAEEFAIRMERPDVWLKLGVAQLEHGIVADGIKSLMRARDASYYALVVDCARNKATTHEDFKMVSKFCRVARKKIREPETARRAIDTELVHALCRIDALTDVEEFIVTQAHYADLEDVGDRCFDVELYTASKMMFRAIEHWPKLAHAHVMLREFREAVHIAKKAKSIPTWRIVCYACVDALEFKLASTCSLRLLVEVDEMQECIDYYEERGHFQEIMDVLELALNSDRAHPAMFTEMAVLLSKYNEDRMLNFCRMWHGRFNIPRVIRACESAHLWAPQVFLFMQYSEWDNAANAMMDHSPSAFSPDEFLDVISRVGALGVMYRAIDFYVGEEPERLEDLLNVLAPRVDCGRTVGMLARARSQEFGALGCLPFAMQYLLKVQSADVKEVNEAINRVFLENGDVDGLNRSVDEYKNFDQMALASAISEHEVVQMRRIGIRLLARNGRHEQAIAVAQQDLLYGDMIQAIAVSQDEELAESYAAWFVSENLRECFTCLLYACYEFFPPDIAMEYAWNGGMRDFAMPFLIQTIAEAGKRLTGLEEERADARERVAIAQTAADEEINEDVSVLLHGLAPTHQTPLLTYHQAGGGVVGGTGGMFGGGVDEPLMIGWSGGYGGSTLAITGPSAQQAMPGMFPYQQQTMRGMPAAMAAYTTFGMQQW